MKKTFITSLFLFFCFSLFSEQLTKFNTSWTSIITGKPVSNPIATSYGFIVSTDAKNIVAVSNNGNILWDKQIKKWSSTIRLSVVQNDFFTITNSRNSDLSLYNPSGVEIWKIKAPFSITKNITPGRDGRFFARNSTNIACLGMNGICKWSIKTPTQADSEIQTLQDGSLIVFLSELVDGKTKALRISPFGEILEEIIFSGKVTSSNTCIDGILLCFSDGNSGLFSLVNNRSTNRWVIKNNNVLESFFSVSNNSNDVVYYSTDNTTSTISIIDSKNGGILNSFTTRLLGVKSIDCTEEGIFIADNQDFYFFSKEGKELWNGSISQKDSSNILFSFFTTDNMLVFLNKDWSISSYKINQTSTKKRKTLLKSTYNSFYDFNSSYISNYISPIDGVLKEKNTYELLQKGFYNSYEKELTSLTNNACQEYLNSLRRTTSNYREEPSTFESDIIGLNNMISLLPLFGTDLYPHFIAEFLKREKNSYIKKTLLTSIIQNGFDPDEEMIKSLEIVVQNKSIKDDSTLTMICDSIYSICLFMGRPAFNDYGKSILTNFLYPPYGSTVRNYARETLKKIGELSI